MTMNELHEPTNDFIDRLERHVGQEARRRSRRVDAPRPWWLSATAVAASMLISMAIGGAAVAAAYEAQASARREIISRPYVQRLDLAKRKLEVVTSELSAAETRFSVGMGTLAQVLEAGLAVADARAQIEIIELQLAEVEITGEDYRNEVSSPLVAGRDFVTQRLLAGMKVPEQALTHANRFAEDVQRKVEIGTVAPIDLEIVRARIVELTMAITTFQRKVDIRRQFLAGKMDKIETELRVLEAEADQMVNTLQPKLKLAQQEAAQLASRFETGTVNQEAVAHAKLRVLTLELELSKAQLDLTVVRRRIQEHRSGK
jgi:outer membrane protein TolC